MTTVAETVQIATRVSKGLADDVSELARRSERSMAAEIRLAVKAWVDAARLEGETRSA